MQGKGAHGIVGIGILPAVPHGGVVDREQLDYALAGFYGPVHQVLDVVELPYAKAVLTAQREHRDGHAGSAPGIGVEMGIPVRYHHQGILGRYLCEKMVGAFFPVKDFLALGIYNNQLVFNGFLHIQGNGPPGEKVVLHEQHFVPVAQFVPAANQGQGLMGAHPGHCHLDAQIAFLGGFYRSRMPERHAAFPAENHIAEGR